MEQEQKKESKLDKFIKMLKGQKTRSESHQLIVLLYDKPNRSADDDKKYQILLKAERAKVAAKKAALAADKMLESGKEAERKSRNHRLILIGTAAEKKLLPNELNALLDMHLVSDADRKIFGLRPKM